MNFKVVNRNRENSTCFISLRYDSKYNRSNIFRLKASKNKKDLYTVPLCACYYDKKDDIYLSSGIVFIDNKELFVETITDVNNNSIINSNVYQYVNGEVSIVCNYSKSNYGKLLSLLLLIEEENNEEKIKKRVDIINQDFKNDYGFDYIINDKIVRKIAIDELTKIN